MDAQNMWWNEIRNTTGVSGNEQEWKDNEGNTYKRSGEGADMRWTKTDVNGNMSEHEWWNDKGWSGDNGTGVKLRDAFSNWLGDISADYINKTHYKPKPPIGSRFKPPADLGSTFAQVQDIIDNGQLNRLKGIKFGDQRINQIEQQEDGTFNLLFSSVMGGDYESGAIVNIDLTKKGTAKETLFNYIGDVDSGNVYTSPRYAEYNLSVDNKVVETGKDTEGITTTSGVNVRKGGAAEVMVGQNLEKMKIANEQLNQIDVVVDKAISDYADNKNWKSIYSSNGKIRHSK